MLDDREYKLFNLQSIHPDMRQHTYLNLSLNSVKYSQYNQIKKYNFHIKHRIDYKDPHFHRIQEDITQNTNSKNEN
jgi:hypothetical protein